MEILVLINFPCFLMGISVIWQFYVFWLRGGGIPETGQLFIMQKNVFSLNYLIRIKTAATLLGIKMFFSCLKVQSKIY